VSESHDNAVREQFRLQAATFTDEGFATRGLDRIVEGLRPAAAEANRLERLRDPSHGRTLTVAEQLRERIGHELGGGEPTGLRPWRDERGTVTITHTWAMITATPSPVG
jgi:hypothetical protein